MGAKEKGGSNAKLNLEYLSVPVMFQYKALPNLYVEAGPQFSFLIDARLKKSASTGALKMQLNRSTLESGWEPVTI